MVSTAKPNVSRHHTLVIRHKEAALCILAMEKEGRRGYQSERRLPGPDPITVYTGFRCWHLHLCGQLSFLCKYKRRPDAGTDDEEWQWQIMQN